MVFSQGDPTVEQVVSAYETACFSGPECTAALNALNGNTDCVNAFNTEDDYNTTVFCTGSCSNLATAALNICPNVGHGITILMSLQLCTIMHTHYIYFVWLRYIYIWLYLFMAIASY